MENSQRGNTEDISAELWYRTFNRGYDKCNKAKNDKDAVATAEQLKEDFVDHFGHLLKTDKGFRKHNTYKELVEHFWKGPESDKFIVQTYAVADGQTVPKDKQKPWFRSELRFLSLILPTDEKHKKGAKAPITSVSWAPWFFFIAASSDIDSEKDILHIMSWHKDDGQFRYYARDLIMNVPKPTAHGWVYLCSSMDAFAEDGKAYMGPLNGHVNGGIVMKELHKPWMHWLVGGRGVQDMLDEDTERKLAAADWLTHPDLPALYGSTVQSGETLEKIIIDATRHWFTSRRSKDFTHPGGQIKTEPDHIQRWAAHFLLSTNVNIAATSNNSNIVPSDFFFNYEMLRGYSDLLPNSRQATATWQEHHVLKEEPKALREWNEQQKQLDDKFNPKTQADWFKDYSIQTFEYNPSSYLWASRELQLCTLQEVEKDVAHIQFQAGSLSGGLFMGTLENDEERIEGGVQTNFAIQQWGEGDNPWVILQSSIEDAMGVWMAQKMFLDKGHGYAHCRLFSDKSFNALMMVDFWNPIYSWRRIKLMQHIPITTKLLLETPVYDEYLGEKVYTFDLEENFIQAVRDYVETNKLQDNEDFPEVMFLANLEKPLIEHQIDIYNYTSIVSGRLQSAKGVMDYLKLAESRRRLFRPLPMNFFGSNLPYCLAICPNARSLEMTKNGQIREIPEYGLKVLSQWLGSLAGNDPQILPHNSLQGLEERREKRVNIGKAGLDRQYLPRPSTMRMACQRSIAITNAETPERRGGCPFLSQATTKA